MMHGRHSLHAVELSQRSKNRCVNCVDPSRSPEMGALFTFWGKPAMLFALGLGLSQSARGWNTTDICKNCVYTTLPPEMGARFHFLGMPAVAPCPMAGSAPHKSMGCRVKSWPDDTRASVIWICDLCAPYTHPYNSYQQHQAQTTQKPIAEKSPPNHSQTTKHGHTSNQH